MMEIKVIFEEHEFIAEVNSSNFVNITNEVRLPVNAQEFYHARQVFIRRFENGDFDVEFNKAIKDEKEVLFL